jgi:hypothetical protein
MGLIRHNLPLFITLAVVFFVIGFLVVGRRTSSTSAAVRRPR